MKNLLNQRELFITMLDNLNNRASVWHFVTSWLEDINWHSENTLLLEHITKEDKAEIDRLQMQHYAHYSQNYSEEFIQSLQLNEEFMEAKKFGNKYNDDLYEFDKANQFYGVMSKLTGWGFNTNDWYCTSSQKLVDDLLSLINNRLKEIEDIEKEKEATRQAYLTD